MRSLVSTVGSFAALAFVAGVVTLAPRSARADDGVSGAYDVKYEEMSNNCTNVGVTLQRGEVTIAAKGRDLEVDVQHTPNLPPMNGVPAKTGAINAKSQLKPSPIGGVDGKFSVAGRVKEGMLQLVFVAEYSVHGKGALCTQSWNVSGLRKDGK